MNKVTESLEARVEDLENHSSRSNVIVYGLPGMEETSEAPQEAANEGIMTKILGLELWPLSAYTAWEFEDKRKMGPAVIKLLYTRGKSAILKDGFNLKLTIGSMIGKHFSRKLGGQKKEFWDSAKENRENTIYGIVGIQQAVH